MCVVSGVGQVEEAGSEDVWEYHWERLFLVWGTEIGGGGHQALPVEWALGVDARVAEVLVD